MSEVLATIVGLTFPIWGVLLFLWVRASSECRSVDREERYAREFNSRH